jgi:hypothetical protein
MHFFCRFCAKNGPVYPVAGTNNVGVLSVATHLRLAEWKSVKLQQFCFLSTIRVRGAGLHSELLEYLSLDSSRVKHAAPIATKSGPSTFSAN